MNNSKFNIHNYYLDFLKSIKRFVHTSFPEIKKYQFNYANKTYLSQQLYKNPVVELPTCMINLSDIRTVDNSAFMRGVGQQTCKNTLQLLANNHTRQETIVMDNKWVILSIDIKINVNSSSDVLTFMDRLLSVYPKDYMFYAYEYMAYINIDHFTKEWSASDDVEGVYLQAKSSDNSIQRYGLYYVEPIFKVVSSQKNKTIEDEAYVQFNLEVHLPVVNAIGNNTIDDRIIEGIQVIINSDKDMPVLLDLDNQVYMDNRNKLLNAIILDESDFKIIDEKYYIILPKDIKEMITNKNIACNIVEDISLKSSKVNFIEFGRYTFDDITSITVDEEIRLCVSDTGDLFNIEFNKFNLIELMIFA